MTTAATYRAHLDAALTQLEQCAGMFPDDEELRAVIHEGREALNAERPTVPAGLAEHIEARLWNSDDLQVDEVSPDTISITEDGVWVQAWMWISNDDFQSEG